MSRKKDPIFYLVMDKSLATRAMMKDGKGGAKFIGYVMANDDTHMTLRVHKSMLTRANMLPGDVDKKDRQAEKEAIIKISKSARNQK